MTKKTDKKSEKVENQPKRKSDNPIGLPRSLVFILTIVLTVIITLFGLIQTGLLVIQPKQTEVDMGMIEKSLNQQQALTEAYTQIAEENTSLRSELNTLKDEFEYLDNQHMELAAQLRKFAGTTSNIPRTALPSPTEVVKVIEKQTDPSPLPALNHLLIRYKQGGDMAEVLGYLQPFASTDTLQAALDDLIVMSTPKVLTSHEIFISFSKLMKNKKAEPVEEKGFLNNLIVVRKKNETKNTYHQQFWPLQKAISHKQFDKAEELLAVLEGEEFDTLKKNVTLYIAQQRALEGFITQYKAFHQGALNGSH